MAPTNTGPTGSNGKKVDLEKVDLEEVINFFLDKYMEMLTPGATATPTPTKPKLKLRPKPKLKSKTEIMARPVPVARKVTQPAERRAV